MTKSRKRTYTKGQWAVEKERLRLPKNAKPRPEPQVSNIADVIPGVMKSAGLESRFWETSLIEEWHILAGPQLVRHTRPGRYDRKILTVFVGNSVWLSELSRFGKHELLKNLQKRFGKEKIKDIRLQLDPDKPGA
jgi:predicted nucleic acid-binding Zn ribbon protein